MSSIFQQIKEKTNLLEVIEFYTEDALKKCGEHWYEMSDRSCPFCGHFDCFKVHYEDGGDNSYHCFSCEAHGDQITFVSKYLPLKDKLEEEELDPSVATKKIAEDFNVKLVYRTLSPVERIMLAAAEYYHHRLLEAESQVTFKKDGQEQKMSALDYQTKIRHHKVGTLVDFQVGFTDGQVSSFLAANKYDIADIVASGIGRIGEDGKLYDFFPAGVFVYPHYKDGICCHFTQKDPQKIIKFQYPGKYRLHDILFFNEDSIRNAKKVYVVEGENDVLSLYDAKADGAIIGTDGSISGRQMEFLRDQLKDKDIVTIFDSDQAGDKYRLKVHEFCKNAVHLRLPDEFNDIDNFLATKTILDAYNYVTRVEVIPDTGVAAEDVPKKHQEASVSIGSYDASTGILERDGCYFKVTTDKEGEQKLVQISDFIIKVKNIFLVDGKRIREIEVVRSDGIHSKSFLIDSETKVSGKAFRAKMADACDATYFGGDNDLLTLWTYVYKKAPERTVDVASFVGDLGYDDSEGKRQGWLFKNSLITPLGDVIKADKSGVMWVNGNSRGVRPRSISADIDNDLRQSRKHTSIPDLPTQYTFEEREAFEREFFLNYARNLGDPGKAAMLVGTLMMSAYSSEIYDRAGAVPFIFVWGSNGSGKTTLLWWLMHLYDMKENGYFTLPNIGSSVGFMRKMAYYSSLPLCLDEIRKSPEMDAIEGKLRAWYNRAQRDIATSGSQSQVFEQHVRSTLIFGGQDMFSDQALRERCIVIRIGNENREKEETYRAINELERTGKLGAIGLHWILNSLKEDMDEVYQEIEDNNTKFKELKVSSRIGWTWAIIGTFARRICLKYFPDFDIDGYLLDACKTESKNLDDGSTLNTFYETIEGMMSEERPFFNYEHFMVDGNRLYIWLSEVHNMVNQKRKQNNNTNFSKEAIKNNMKEQTYYAGDSVQRMGTKRVSRRVVAVDVSHTDCPLSLKNLAVMFSGS